MNSSARDIDLQTAVRDGFRQAWNTTSACQFLTLELEPDSFIVLYFSTYSFFAASQNTMPTASLLYSNTQD